MDLQLSHMLAIVFSKIVSLGDFTAFLSDFLFVVSGNVDGYLVPAHAWLCHVMFVCLFFWRYGVD